MGLSTSLNTAVAGLNATQIGIGVVSQNVANADKPGYVRRQVSTVDSLAGNTVGTHTTAVQRLLDVIVQRQLWQETSGAAYTATRADALSSLDRLYGAPGSTTALDSVYNRFTGALQALQNDPSSYSLRTGVIDAANELAGRLNGLSDGVQALRQQAEAGIGNAVTQVNSLLNSLTSVNAKIVGSPNSGSTAELKDQRDRIVAELSQYIDIKTSEDARGSLNIVTASGTQIFDGRPAITLSFDEHTNIAPNSQWSSDPTQRGVGTIKMTNSAGNSVDAIANGVFRSGEIAAYVELRDKTLVQSQAQLDEIAAQMSSALSDRRSRAPSRGRRRQARSISPSTSAHCSAATASASTTRRRQAARTSASPSSMSPPGRPCQPRRKAMPTTASSGSIFPPGRPLSRPRCRRPSAAVSPSPMTGSTLSIADDGAVGTRDVVGLTARPTSTTLDASGSAELPFFVDGGRSNAVFTGSYEGGSQTAALPVASWSTRL
jgi:flagellar hook-associated protein 1 FlgK